MENLLTDMGCVPGREYPLVDLARPARPNGAAIFFVHGGGWTGGSRRQWHAVMEYFADLGYVCASTSYRFAPEHRFPAQFEDVRLAFAWFKARADEYGFDPHRIATWGSSAGGHLATLLATVSVTDPLGATADLPTHDTVPAAVVCLCGVLDVSGRWAGTLFDADKAADPERIRRASPIERVRGGEPPLLMIVGDADETTPVTVHERMRDRFAACGGTVELHVLPGVEHGYGYGVSTPAQKRTVELAADFLARHLRPATGAVPASGRRCQREEPKAH